MRRTFPTESTRNEQGRGDEQGAAQVVQSPVDSLRAVLENLPSGLIVADMATHVMQWNRHALMIHGYAEDENEYKSLESLVADHELKTLSGEPVPVRLWPLPRLMRGESFSDYELLVRHVRKGWERVFSYSALVVPRPEGALGLLAIADVTGRARAERAMRQSQQFLRTTMDNFPAAIAFKGREHRFVDVNRAVEEALSLPKQQVIGRTLHDLGPPDAAELLHAREREVMESRRAIQYEVETAVSGDPRVHLTTCYPLVDPDGGVYGTGHISLDVTTVKRIEAELRLANEQLLEADRRKTEFLATLAHELRNLLAPLGNALHILGQSTDPTIAAEARAMMSRQLNQLVRLVDDLLDVSRITTGKLKLSRERLEIHRVVEQAIENARPLIDSRRHRLVFEPAHRDLRVMGDAVRLSQVLTNLLNNAAKYTEPGGMIVVTIEAHEPDRVQVRVGDSGIGIDAEALPRVFDLFVQIEAGATRRMAGSVSDSVARAPRRDARRHLFGGKRRTRARRGFYARSLPVAAELFSAGPAGPALRAGVSAPCSVVVVDDNRDAADSLAIALKMKGHECFDRLRRQGGGRGHHAARAHVAIIDIGMPGFDGYQVARALREMPWRRKPRIDRVDRLGSGRGQAEHAARRIRPSPYEAGRPRPD